MPQVQSMPNTSGTEVVARVEQFGMKLAHQFPWNPAAGVAVGLALRRRFLSDPEAVSHLTRRQQIMAVSADSCTVTAPQQQGLCANLPAGASFPHLKLCPPSYSASRSWRRAQTVVL